ncbi:unnamed protein product [Vitrella brassicaformis CCMP3155]|uniref:AIG1-type G domain-containing protein n=1 Tax=Vitrella brassicaformis (strain CCMP3155) TaxID=1169540 RepID=A0A0G4GHL0_VITBC|nr:unnamed protein product [Vitrella brassicaformis CCMP3155]|mmetsp:Transcript_24654/g.71133  ORF Transcript_24654/g.71133 Transcript_24654/m.71133 type:complete len:334 (+) Transcript_24654:1351-2352(+)|eukprot:CEM29217.1 unnamed protein product [Vitrella brassicaformis CCMP3155]
MDPQQPISIVLLGATGNGKSTLANIICGDEKFEAKDDVSSVTQRCQHADFTYRGKCYRVVDTVGFKDTSLSDEQVMEQLQQISIHAMEGVTAFIIVLRHGRLTSLDHASLEATNNIFTKEAEGLKKHACIVVTHTGKNTSDGLVEMIKKSDNVKYKSWCDKVDGRVLAAEKKNQATTAVPGPENQVERVVRTAILAMVDKIDRDNSGQKWSHNVMKERHGHIKALVTKALQLDGHFKSLWEEAHMPRVHAGRLDLQVADGILEDFLNDQAKRRCQENQPGTPQRGNERSQSGWEREWSVRMSPRHQLTLETLPRAPGAVRGSGSRHDETSGGN